MAGAQVDPGGAGGGSSGAQQPSRGQTAGGVGDSWQPAGTEAVVWADQYEKDQEGGWVWGNHREATAEQLQQMKDMVRQHRDCFAYSMAELPGYKDPVSIGSYSGAPAYCRPKQYSPVEKQIIQQKGEELRDAGIITQLPLDNPFAARPTIAAKKDAETGHPTRPQRPHFR